MHAPFAWTLRRFGTARRDQRAVEQSHRLVFDWAKDAVGQPSGIAPGSPVIARRSNHPPPRLWTWTDLVEQQQLVARHLEEDRVPARMARGFWLDARGYFNRSRPQPALNPLIA